MTTIYVTKYALTRGILVYESSIEDLVDRDGSVIVRDPDGINKRAYYRGNDWHISPDAAMARAEEMRTAKIDSLRKQLSRMQALEIRVEKIGGSDAHTTCD